MHTDQYAFTMQFMFFFTVFKSFTSELFTILAFIARKWFNITAKLDNT